MQPVEPVPLPDRTPGCRQIFGGDPPKTVVRRIDRLLDNKNLTGGQLGVLAVAYPEGRVLYERNANTPVNPASVTKLFTAAAILAALGPDHRFTTSLHRLAGKDQCPPLYVKGGGDPGLEVKDLEILIDKARDAGVTCAERLVYDISLFDDQILPPHYDQKKSDAHWRPKTGAFGISDGSLDIRVYPGDYPDAAPRVSVKPDCSCLMVDSRAVTVEEVAEGKHLAVSVGLLSDKTVVRLSGQVPMKRKNGYRFRKAIPHPDAFSGCLFRDLLEEHGVKVSQRSVTSGIVPKGARKVASINSNSLKTDLRRMQRWSKNYVAEQFARLAGIGHCTPLTFNCGLRNMRRILHRFHINPTCLQWENGSGLYDANRFSPAQVVRLLLELANKSPWAEIYRKALPLGAESGTLRGRMKRVTRAVRAKTGTLDNHSSLAGYIDRKGNGYIAFAILFAEVPTSAYRMRRIQDRIVEHLANWSPP